MSSLTYAGQIEEDSRQVLIRYITIYGFSTVVLLHNKRMALIRTNVPASFVSGLSANFAVEYHTGTCAGYMTLQFLEHAANSTATHCNEEVLYPCMTTK